MTTVLEIPESRLSSLGTRLRKCRNEWNLSLTQAATALEIAPVTLESWELGRKKSIDLDDVKRRYADYVSDTELSWKRGKNVLFGCFPLRVARDLLDLTVEEIAEKFGFKVSIWKKMEANSRFMPEDKILEIEREVHAVIGEACSLT